MLVMILNRIICFQLTTWFTSIVQSRENMVSRFITSPSSDDFLQPKQVRLKVQVQERKGYSGDEAQHV